MICQSIHEPKNCPIDNTQAASILDAQDRAHWIFVARKKNFNLSDAMADREGSITSLDVDRVR